MYENQSNSNHIYLVYLHMQIKRKICSHRWAFLLLDLRMREPSAQPPFFCDRVWWKKIWSIFTPNEAILSTFIFFSWKTSKKLMWAGKFLFVSMGGPRYYNSEFYAEIQERCPHRHNMILCCFGLWQYSNISYFVILHVAYLRILFRWTVGNNYILRIN